jgi:hypothetical protein
LQIQLDFLGLKIKTGMLQDATFIHSDLGHAKKDKPHENEVHIQSVTYHPFFSRFCLFFFYEIGLFDH